MIYTGKRKLRVGVVVSDKMNKTVVVSVTTLRRHPIYKKAIRRTKKYKVHDENNTCRIGDSVRIVETRPLSKEKRWQVVEIISKRAATKAEVSGMEKDTELLVGIHGCSGTVVETVTAILEIVTTMGKTS